MEYFTWLNAKLELDRGDAVDPRQLVFQEGFIGRQIGCDDAQEIIAVAGHQITLQDLIPFRNRLCKTIEVLFLLSREFYGNEDADVKSERFLVDGCDVASDHAALFHQLDPTMAWRGGKADLVGEFLHRHAAVGLQQAEDLAVDGVKGIHWHKLGLQGLFLVFYANFAGDVAMI